MSVVNLNMRPIPPRFYVADGFWSNAIHVSYLALNNAIVEKFAYVKNIVSFKFGIYNLFSLARNRETSSVRVLDILRSTTPLKIYQLVICFASVNVINLIKCIWVRQKCQSNQTMNIKRFSAGIPTTQTNCNVTTTRHRLLQNLPYALFAKCRNFIAVSVTVTNRFWVVDHPVNRSNTPKIRHLISTFITNNWKPNFLHLKFSIKELSLLKSARQASNESAFWGIPLSAQKDYTPCQS